jgi:tungstate transport system ATP-binding protein
MTVFDWQQVDVRLGPRGQVHALRQVTLRIAAGERVAVVGANGSGKSTLMRALHGLVPVASGRSECRPQRLAMLFQKPFLLRLSALLNVRIGAWLAGMPWRQTREPALDALRRVGLADLAQRNARALSGGQQQRLALARAWVQAPQVWLLDEPTASLDPQARQEVEQLMLAFADQGGATLVFASHHLGQVRRLASRVLYLERGRLLADLPVDQFFNPDVLAAHSPQASAFVQGEIA